MIGHGMMRRTPGPFELAEATATIPIRSTATGKTIASVRYGPTDLGDATLLAASWELLEALRELLERMESPRTRTATEAWDRARAAIDKAEGRQ